MKKNLFQKRKILSLVVLLIGLVSSALIVSGSSQISSTGPLVSIVNDSSSTNQAQNLNFVIKPPLNLTNAFENQALRKLINENQPLAGQGITDPKKLQLLPNDTDIQKMISDIIDSDAVNETIGLKDILVNNDNSQNTQIAYLLLINQIIQTPPDNSVVGDPSQDLTTSFSTTAQYYGHIADMLLAVNVPPDWLQIHKQIVEFFLRQKNIFQSLAAANEDPLRFMVALNRVLPDEFNNEFTAIQNQIQQKIQDEKLI